MSDKESPVEPFKRALINTMRTTLENRPEAVKCFVDGSILGWTNYMYGDRTAANALIQKDNPDMSQDKIDFAISQLNKYGIVDSGDSLTMGIGTMTDERIKSFYDKMVTAGVIDADLDYKQSYTLEYVNKGLGVDLKKKLMGN